MSVSHPELPAGETSSKRAVVEPRPFVVPSVALDAIAIAAVAGFAGAVNAYYGPRGFMPLDHSVVFDGGWRTAVGQVPFRDYTTPNALTPSFLQGLFFLALGVTWKAYVLHATVFNALFAVLVYVLLRLCGGRRLVATLYGALSGLVFYPPLGVPFHDQHAFFFALLAITLAVATRSTGPRLGLGLWTMVPFALAAAALSKQTPALLATPVVLALALVPTSKALRAFRGLLVGAAACLSLVMAAGILARVDWSLVRVFFFELPLETGESRGDRADATAASLYAVAVLFATVGVGPVLVGRLRGRPLSLPEGVALPVFLSTAFMLICGAFVTLTLNEPAEGLPLFFASLGLFHIAVVRLLPDWPLAGRLTVASAAGGVIAVVALAAGWSYNTQVNEHRSASNIIFDEALVERDLPPSLASMHFQVPARYPGFHAADLRRVARYLEAQPGSFVHVGDTSILNGVTDTPSVFPALFFSVGLTIPERGTSELRAFEKRLFDSLGKHDVRRVVLERHTWESGSIEDLPRFQAWLARCRGTTRTFGFFQVVDVPSPRTCA